MRTEIGLDILRWQVLYGAAVRCRLGAGALRLLAVMLRRVDLAVWHEDGSLLTWPSYLEIQREAHVKSCGTISQQRRELVAAGLISAAPGYQRGGPDPIAIYRINAGVKVTEETRAAAALVRTLRQKRQAYICARRSNGVDACDLPSCAGNPAQCHRAIARCSLSCPGTAGAPAPLEKERAMRKSSGLIDRDAQREIIRKILAQAGKAEAAGDVSWARERRNDADILAEILNLEVPAQWEA
jgi:Replication protein C N-terminal domain